MIFKDDLISARDAIIGSQFSVSDAQVVPKTEDVGYNDAKKLQATYLYADMVDSSGLVGIAPQQTVGKVLRLYLDLSVRIIRNRNGYIRSFDGDRVMGIFIGDGRQDRAVKAAMNIKWACQEIIQPKLTYKSIKNAGWKLQTGCGIASGEALIIRGGVRRSSSDLVSVGAPPNLAAKLSDIRDGNYNIRIGAGAFSSLSRDCLISKDKNMWQGAYELTMAGKTYNYYRTSYHWSM